MKGDGEMIDSSFYMGVDLGQARDATAGAAGEVGIRCGWIDGGGVLFQEWLHW